jgi:hypothetical protein
VNFVVSYCIKVTSTIQANFVHRYVFVLRGKPEARPRAGLGRAADGAARTHNGHQKR